MVKAILLGNQQCQWNISGHMLPGGVPQELTEEELIKHKDCIKEIIGKKEEKLEEKVTEKPKKYTEKELFELSKDEQTEILKKFNIFPIPKSEKERVKAILMAEEEA